MLEFKEIVHKLKLKLKELFENETKGKKKFQLKTENLKKDMVKVTDIVAEKVEDKDTPEIHQLEGKSSTLVYCARRIAASTSLYCMHHMHMSVIIREPGEYAVMENYHRLSGLLDSVTLNTTEKNNYC